MSVFKTNFRRDQAIANEYLGGHVACNQCRKMTEAQELMAHGARCLNCYEAYLSEANPAGWPQRRLTPEERSAVRDRGLKSLQMLRSLQKDAKSWARDLQRREEGGETLTTIQSQAWKEALKPRFETEVSA